MFPSPSHHPDHAGWMVGDSAICLPIFLPFLYITRNLKSNGFYPETNTSTSSSPQTSSPPIFTSLSFSTIIPCKVDALLYFLFWLKHVYSFSTLMVTFTLLTIKRVKRSVQVPYKQKLSTCVMAPTISVQILIQSVLIPTVLRQVFAHYWFIFIVFLGCYRRNV